MIRTSSGVMKPSPSKSYMLKQKRIFLFRSPMNKSVKFCTKDYMVTCSFFFFSLRNSLVLPPFCDEDTMALVGLISPLL